MNSGGQEDRSGNDASPQGPVIEPSATILNPHHVKAGESVYIGHYALIDGGENGRITIGRGTWIGQFCLFDGRGGITIGENVGIGPGVKIIASHYGSPSSGPSADQSIVIEDDADIGVAAIILPGAIIGRGAQIGAGAVVASPVPPYAVAAGNPAQVMRMRGGKA